MSRLGRQWNEVIFDDIESHDDKLLKIIKIPITNVSVEAMVIVRTMKNIATARQEEQPRRSEKYT